MVRIVSSFLLLSAVLATPLSTLWANEDAKEQVEEEEEKKEKGE